MLIVKIILLNHFDRFAIFNKNTRQKTDFLSKSDRYVITCHIRAYLISFLYSKGIKRTFFNQKSKKTKIYFNRQSLVIVKKNFGHNSVQGKKSNDVDKEFQMS